MKITLLLALTLLLPATAQIVVNGLSNQNTYNGEATFTVPSEIGFSTSAELDGNPVPLNTSTTESGPGYHELLLTKTPEAGGTSETETIQFIVRDPNRPSSDNGISTWTPLPSVAAPATVLDDTIVEFITPCSVTPGMTFPIVVRLTNPDGKIARLNAHSLISDSSGNAETLKLRRGAGAGSWTATSELPFVITLHLGNRTFSREIFVNPFPPQFLGGELTESTDIISAFIYILSNITVPADMTLRFGEDCLVHIPPGVTIEILGKLEIAGSPANPTLFYTQDPTRPWGGIFLRGGATSADIDGAFFTGGGAESNWTSNNGFSSHRKEQPIFTFDA